MRYLLKKYLGDFLLVYENGIDFRSHFKGHGVERLFLEITESGKSSSILDGYQNGQGESAYNLILEKESEVALNIPKTPKYDFQNFGEKSDFDENLNAEYNRNTHK